MTLNIHIREWNRLHNDQNPDAYYQAVWLSNALQAQKIPDDGLTAGEDQILTKAITQYLAYNGIRRDQIDRPLIVYLPPDLPK